MKYLFLVPTFFTLSLFAQDGTTAGCLENLTVPSTLTPNADGNNDVFYIPFPCQPASFQIKVFNSWGDVVFESTEFFFRWTGTNPSGVDQPGGVYVYTVTYTDDVQTYSQSGEIVLVR